MGDSAEFEKLTELEARLARALDRISAGIAAGAGGASRSDAGQDGGDLAAAEEARAEAEARAAEMSERVDALEARLAETQDTLAETQQELTKERAEAMPSVDMATLNALEGRAAEAEARRGTVEAELAARTATIAEMRAALDAAADELEAARAQAQAAPEVNEDHEAAIAVLNRRLERVREERDAARAECDAAKDVADELRATGDGDPDDRMLELRRDLRVAQARAEDLAAQLEKARTGDAADGDARVEALQTELQALRDLRGVEAAELGRIVADLEAGIETADEVSHA
ncbi:hypothetical protein [Hasllibacter sp. MH4015]|uniref:hypothetical protein n=1 Tax=Hasllibacter sp. MH4015 TaxID=2854029 RepID=UPI001CD7ED34|nr:hypothetical protein [Hasllibacter sp. MH4015]